MQGCFVSRNNCLVELMVIILKMRMGVDPMMTMNRLGLTCCHDAAMPVQLVKL